MQLKAILGALLLLAIVQLPARAAILEGAGFRSCGDWTVDRAAVDQSTSQVEESWVQGFLSAVGWAGVADPLAETDENGVFGWIDNYCRENPVNNLEAAAIAFVGAHPK